MTQPPGEEGEVPSGSEDPGDLEPGTASAGPEDADLDTDRAGLTRRERLDELVDRMRTTARRDLSFLEERRGVMGDPVPVSSRYARPHTADLTPHNVPYGITLAASWSWRLIVIAAAGFGLLWLLGYFSGITIPIAIAVLVSALIRPFVDGFERLFLPRSAATLLVLVLGLGAVVGMLTLVGQQVAAQFGDLQDKVVDGLKEIQDWARNGPLGLSDDQLNSWINQVTRTIEEWGRNGTGIVDRVTQLGTTVTHLVTGFFIVVFASYFFLYHGGKIWDWVVRLFPYSAREHADTSGRVAWASLTAFVRATVLVALVDAFGIAVVAWLLGVPLVLAIATLVFLGAFIPIVGAFVSGLVAVLVALVAQGPWTAVFMLIGVVVVQQIESHILQPFLMGHLVQLHPLAIILVIAGGVAVAGIVGALLAVPLAACVNAVVRHLAGRAEAARLARDAEIPPAEPPPAPAA